MVTWNALPCHAVALHAPHVLACSSRAHAAGMQGPLGRLLPLLAPQLLHDLGSGSQVEDLCQTADQKAGPATPCTLSPRHQIRAAGLLSQGGWSRP